MVVVVAVALTVAVAVAVVVAVAVAVAMVTTGADGSSCNSEVDGNVMVATTTLQSTKWGLEEMTAPAMDTSAETAIMTETVTVTAMIIMLTLGGSNVGSRRVGLW